MSQSPDHGRPGSGGQPDSSGQPGRAQPGNDGGQSRTNGRSAGGGQSRRSDPLADFQRWLMRAGTRSMANQVADQVKRTLAQERRDYGDVWDTATNEIPPDEPPECQWCPICQAARAARMSGPGLGARLADAGGLLASMVQDAFTAFEQALKAQDQARSPGRQVTSAPPEASPPPPPAATTPPPPAATTPPPAPAQGDSDQ